MKLYCIIHSMLAQKGANAIKIISVAVGLLVSCLIFSRLAYNYSFDTCFSGADRLYQVKMEYVTNGVKIGPFQTCVGKLSGAINDEMAAYAASSTQLYYEVGNLLNGNQLLDVLTVATDSMFFDTMGIETLSGHPRHDLARPGTVFISESLARRLYGDDDPAGRALSIDGVTQLTVSGVFSDLPQNVSLIRFDAVIALLNMPEILEKRYFWEGGDCYLTYFRLRDDCPLDERGVNAELNKMYQAHVPDSDRHKSKAIAMPIRKVHLANDEVRRMNVVMWALGLSLLLMTVLNYVLITIASLSRRAKSVGVHKCSGASAADILVMFIGETVVVLLLAAVVMAMMMLALEPVVKEIIGLDAAQLLSPPRLWIYAAVFAFFIAVGGVMPARVFAKIPVTRVFRRFNERNGLWKRGLLFIQIAGVAFVMGLLAMVSAQYNDVMNYDGGFVYGDRVKLNRPPEDGPRDIINDPFLNGLKAQPFVESVTWGCANPIHGNYSGEYVKDAAGNPLFNTRIDWVDASWVDFFEVPLAAGTRDFRKGDVIVNETFARRMGWTDNAVGLHAESIENNGPLRVKAVVKDFLIGNLTDEPQPLALVVSDWLGFETFVTLKEPFDVNLRKLEAYVKQAYPTADLSLASMREMHDASYRDVLMFRNSVLATVIALMFIAVMGMTGFTRDEVERRRKEVAIRKVNGADSMSIIMLIAADIFKVVAPAIAAGTVGAWLIGRVWLENFRVTAPDLWAWYLLSAIAVGLLVTSCAVIATWRTANENPVNQLKSE